ncbi:hypothetical protein TNCV_1534541 [Trichonephila clavipes]|nr:hypothetical protein TNCV_1534541 [Trichonephila clavipes]
MSEGSFEVGDLVWVKKTNYPLWPARISQPPKEEKREKMCYVYFLGSHICDWVANKKIQHHAEHLIPSNYEETSFFLKHAIDEIILLSKDKSFKKDTKASPQVVQNLEEKKCMEDKQLMEEEQSTIERHSYKGDAATLKEKQPSLKKPVKEKQPPVKEPVKEKQSPIKELEKEKQSPVEGKQPSSKEPEKEKQPPQSSLKKQVKNNHPLVEKMTLLAKRQRLEKMTLLAKRQRLEKMTLLAKRQRLEKMTLLAKRQRLEKMTLLAKRQRLEKMTLLAKRQQLEKKQPPIKQNQTSINTNPVRGKRKYLEQITSTGKVSKKEAIDEIILLSKDKPFKKDTKASPQVVQNLEEKCMEDKQLMKEEQSPIERHSYKGDAATLKEKQPSLKKPVKEKQPPVKEPVKEKQSPIKELEKEKQPPVEGKQPSSKEPEKEKQPPQSSLKKQVKNNHPPVEKMTLLAKRQRLEKMILLAKRHWQEKMTLLAKRQQLEKKQPPIKQNQTSINTNPVRGKRKYLEQITSTGKVSKKEAIDEIILLSKDKPFKKDTKASPQVVQNLEEKCMEDKQLMKEEQSPIERHSYKGDAATLKEKQPSLKKPVKEKQPPVKEPVKEKQSPIKELEKEKQPAQSSLKKQVKSNPPVEKMTLLAKRQWLEKMILLAKRQWQEKMTLLAKRQRLEKKQPPIKQNQTSINTNPVRGKRKHLEQITSTGKVSKKAKKAGVSVKSPRVVQRKRSLSKESVIGETSMSIPCSSKIQKIDEEDSLRSSHNGLSADLSNPKDLKSDDEAVSEASSSSSDWHSGLLCPVFNTKNDDRL